MVNLRCCISAKYALVFGEITHCSQTVHKSRYMIPKTTFVNLSAVSKYVYRDVT